MGTNKQEVYTDYEQRSTPDKVKLNKMTETEIKLLKRLEQAYLAGICTYTDMMIEYKEFVIKQYNEQIKRNTKTEY